MNHKIKLLFSDLGNYKELEFDGYREMYDYLTGDEFESWCVTNGEEGHMSPTMIGKVDHGRFENGEDVWRWVNNHTICEKHDHLHDICQYCGYCEDEWLEKAGRLQKVS